MSVKSNSCVCKLCTFDMQQQQLRMTFKKMCYCCRYCSTNWRSHGWNCWEK